MCVEISEDTEHDVFFEYLPHVNGFSVHYNKGGWKANEESTYLFGGYQIFDVDDTETMEKVIEELMKLKDTK